MIKKALFALFFSAICLNSYSQSTVGHNWQFGIGGGLVRFSDKDAPYIGDKHLMQIPRFNATKRITEDFSADLAVSFGSFDSSLINNNVPYFSFDLSARYKYIQGVEKLDPFIFVGGSVVDSHPRRRTTPTFNIGTGVSYWIAENIGLSTQLYYKHSLDSYESMRSHIQITGGVIFGLNLGKNNNRKPGTGSSCYYNQHK